MCLLNATNKRITDLGRKAYTLRGAEGNSDFLASACSDFLTHQSVFRD